MLYAKQIVSLNLTDAWLKIAQLQRELARERQDLASGNDESEAEADAEYDMAEAIVEDVLRFKVKRDVSDSQRRSRGTAR